MITEPFSDPDDDTFTFDVIVSGENTAAGWTANNGTAGGYDVVVSFGPFDISNGAQNITITDNNNATCMTDINVDPPLTCSDDCVVTALPFTIVCDDNMTPTIDSDDTYTITVNATTMGGGAMFDVFNGMNPLGSFNYDEGGSFEINANSTTLTITIADVDNPSCQTTQLIGDLIPCSNDCDLTITQSSAVCFDNNTPTITGDDYYEITVNATAVNGGTQFNVISGINVLDTYDYGVGGVITLPALGNNLILEFVDVDNNTCFEIVDLGNLDPCSSECSITINNITGVCNDNMTTTDDTDDFYTFSFNVSGLNNAATYNVLKWC